ncbi:RagB/SusD family nutrient uptake outer membrane protein [Spirosoma aerophilum]
MKKKIIFMLVAGLMSLGSCKQSFLDLKPYDSLPAADALRTEADLSTALNGMYSTLRNANLYGRTIPFIGDLSADNIYLSANNSGRYPQQYQLAVSVQNADIQNTWTLAYTTILQANNIINSQVASSVAVSQYKGEALTIRALMYWELVKLFAKPYTTDPASPGVPLVLTYDQSLRPARNTVKEVYTQITTDLTQAFTQMAGTRPNSSYVTKYAAEALLAKVYLYQADYTNALKSAQDVIASGGYKLLPSENLNAYWANPTPRTDKAETIFEVSVDGVANVGFDALANMYNQAGYGDGLVTTDLYNLYSATDARRGLIISGAGTKAGAGTYVVNKYQNVTNNADKDDIKVIRYADVLLIAAESAARTGSEATARTLLNQLAQNRDPSFAGYTVSGGDLINTIITERRKELAFEGDRFDDLNRLNLPLTRNDQYPASARTIPAGDYRRVNPIPQVELDANKQIIQNTGY